MSTTRPYPPGDRGPDPDGPAASAAPPAAPPPGPPPGRIRQLRRLHLIGASGAVPRARDFTREALRDWGWLPAATADQRAAAEDVLLVVSELVTNACLHAEGATDLRLTLDGEHLLISVSDRSPVTPPLHPPDRQVIVDEAEFGRGMVIVDALACAYGCLNLGDRKETWADLEVTARPAMQHYAAA
jgi:anti-sigma regulatory factor (Ser/Thr protein kinase)